MNRVIKLFAIILLLFSFTNCSKSLRNTLDGTEWYGGGFTQDGSSFNIDLKFYSETLFMTVEMVSSKYAPVTRKGTYEYHYPDVYITIDGFDDVLCGVVDKDFISMEIEGITLLRK